MRLKNQFLIILSFPSLSPYFASSLIILEPDKWRLNDNNVAMVDRMYTMLLKEVEVVAGPSKWNPSFFPPGVFQDNDVLKYKLLNNNDRRTYMEEVVTRVILSTESKIE